MDQFQERYIVREMRLFRLVIAHFVIFKLERARLAPPQTSPRCKTKQLNSKSQQKLPVKFSLEYHGTC